MSQNAQRDMSGVLFRNERREKPSQPEFKGSATINGIEFWVSAWVKEGKSKFFSLAFDPKNRTSRPAPDRPLREDINDEIPF